MSRRRRAVLLIAVALILGGLAANNVASRESDLGAKLGPVIPVVVAQTELRADRTIRADQLAIRHIPQRYAPVNTATDVGDVVGSKPLVTVTQGSFISGEQFADRESESRGPRLRGGERIAQIVATGDPAAVVVGARVDVVVTADGSDSSDSGHSRLALQDVQVLSSEPAAVDDGVGGKAEQGPRVSVSLRVRLAQAVMLAAAQNYAREVRLLVRAPDDHQHFGAVRSSGDS